MGAPSPILAPLRIWLAPRRAGRAMINRHVWVAVLIHVLSLPAAVGILAAIVAALESGTVAPANSGNFVLMLFDHVATGLLSQASVKLGSGQIMALATLVVVGEVFYWCFAIPVLGSWMGANMPRKRQARLGVLLAGYASVWLIPLILSWAAGLAFLVFALPYFRQLRGGGLWESPLPLIICCVLSTVVPAGMFAMALRLSRGLGEAAHEELHFEDVWCESCGYNLHATPSDHLCPECGVAAAHSYLGDLRTSLWEAGRERFIRTLWRMLSDPRAFFDTIRAHALDQPARRFLVLSTLLSSLLLILTMVLPIAASRAAAMRMRVYGFDGIGGAIGLGILLAGVWAVAVPAFSMMAASVLTGMCRRQGDRLAARGAFKVACYASGVAIPWSFLLGALVHLDAYMGFATRSRATADSARIMVWAIVAVGMLVWYWILGSRAYDACRWANH